MKNKHNTRGFASIFIIILIASGVIAIGSYYFTKNSTRNETLVDGVFQPNQDEPTSPKNSTDTSSPIITKPAIVKNTPPPIKSTSEDTSLMLITPKGGEVFKVGNDERAGISASYNGTIIGIPLYYLIDMNGKEIAVKEISRATDCKTCTGSVVYIGVSSIPRPAKYKFKICDPHTMNCKATETYFTIDNI